MIYTLTLNPALDRELTIEGFTFDTVLRASKSILDCGGKGFNVSRAVAALGGQSVALGFVGGATGERLSGELDALGIETDFVRIAGETRTNTSIVTDDHAHYLKVNEAGPSIGQAEQETLLEKCRSLARPGDWWMLGGSLPPGVPTSFYSQAVEIVQGAGAYMIVDTIGEPLRLACQKRPYIAKPNHIEAGELAGMPFAMDNAPAVLSKIHSIGVQNIVLSLGKDGALLSDGDQIWLAQAPKIEERNPIGAGDALVAGLVWALSNGLSLLESLTWGIASGAAAASLSGTAVGSRQMVQELKSRVSIRPFAKGV
jgi:1-phosphofructokinase family hexose kinase